MMDLKVMFNVATIVFIVSLITTILNWILFIIVSKKRLSTIFLYISIVSVVIALLSGGIFKITGILLFVKSNT